MYSERLSSIAVKIVDIKGPVAIPIPKPIKILSVVLNIGLILTVFSNIKAAANPLISNAQLEIIDKLSKAGLIGGANASKD